MGTYVSVAYLSYLLDCKSGKCIQLINPAKHLKLKGSVSCIGCIALDASESWLVSALSVCEVMRQIFDNEVTFFFFMEIRIVTYVMASFWYMAYWQLRLG